MQKKQVILAIISILTLSFQNIFGSSYREIHGHWQGIIQRISETKYTAFDIFDAPCKWQQPNETPYILVDQQNKSSIISTVSAANGDTVLPAFEMDGLLFNPTYFDEKNMEGEIESKTIQGHFKFTKSSALPALTYCYHKDQAIFDKDRSSIFPLFTLLYSNGDTEYCCSNGVFSPCTLRSTCTFSSMNENGMYEFKGTLTGGNYQGTVTRTQPQPATIIGNFTMLLKSSCSSKPYE